MMISDDLPTVTTTAEIPVIFYDGEREIDLGKVQITPSMTFKLLQSTLSNKIGISPNHITIYFDRNGVIAGNHHHHHRRRHPVTSKFDFSAVEIAGCFFWVVLKRGRRNRRRRNAKNDAGGVDGGGHAQPFVLLRRGGGGENDWEYFEYFNRLRMIDQIEREKERYLMSLNLNSNVYNELSAYHHHNHHNYNNNNNFNYDYDYNNGSSNYSDDYYHSDEIASCSSSTGGASSDRVFCDVCYNSTVAGGEAVPFHWCKNDVIVTARTRPPVGPIAPPLKTGLRG